eukprot:09997.XXX_278508_277250_1 [CDS] Oithona nana genome sequencing.
MSGLRQRKKTFGRTVEDLDAFPKVAEPYVEQEASSAIVYIITMVLVFILIYNEWTYFLNPDPVFKFVPDADFAAKLQINIDMTVAMPCDSMGADILDSTNQNTFTFGRLKEENTWFELDHLQRQHFDSIKMFNAYLREEFHAIHHLLWKSGSNALYGELPDRRQKPDEPFDACRVHGSLTLNKVSGNFHIAAGKSVPLMRGHAHLTTLFDDQDANFTHRIDRFSFGDPHGSIIQPLEGDEKITENSQMKYQYFIEVVPTDIQSLSGTWRTYQYSVKELARPIDHTAGSHGAPGIYFRYDMSALKVVVKQDREPLWTWLVKLCAGVGGLISTSNILCDIISWVRAMIWPNLQKTTTVK